MYGLTAHQAKELSIILEGLDRIQVALSEARDEVSETNPASASFGEGYWLDLGKVTVRGDAGELYGTIQWDDFWHRFYLKEEK